MATVVVGNKNVGPEYLTEQYIFAGRYMYQTRVELYKKNGVVGYLLEIPYDQLDDGKYEIEFYFYYRKPTSSEFWNNFYSKNDFYIFPFLAQLDDGSYYPYGYFEANSNTEYDKISLVNRESGWIHTTLHVEEPMWGTFTGNGGKVYKNPYFFGIFSPLFICNWDTGISTKGKPVEYQWDENQIVDEFDEIDYYDLITNGNMGCADFTIKNLSIFPSFYFTYKDITIDSKAYTASLNDSVRLYSTVFKNGQFKRMLEKELKISETTKRITNLKRFFTSKAGISHTVSKTLVIGRSIFDEYKTEDENINKQMFIRLMKEANKIDSELKRKLLITRKLQSSKKYDDETIRDLLIMRSQIEEITSSDFMSNKSVFKRIQENIAETFCNVTRLGVSFRNTSDELIVEAKPFASRLFYRMCSSVTSFWDWLKGKIRETNNVVTFFCPVDFELDIECKL